MRGYNIFFSFYGKIWKLIPKLLLLPILIWSIPWQFIATFTCDYLRLRPPALVLMQMGGVYLGGVNRDEETRGDTGLLSLIMLVGNVHLRHLRKLGNQNRAVAAWKGEKTWIDKGSNCIYRNLDYLYIHPSVYHKSKPVSSETLASVNLYGDTCSGGATLPFSIFVPSQWAQHLKKRICSLRSKFIPLTADTILDGKQAVSHKSCLPVMESKQ